MPKTFRDIKEELLLEYEFGFLRPGKTPYRKYGSNTSSGYDHTALAQKLGYNYDKERGAVENALIGGNIRYWYIPKGDFNALTHKFSEIARVGYEFINEPDQRELVNKHLKKIRGASEIIFDIYDPTTKRHKSQEFRSTEDALKFLGESTEPMISEIRKSEKILGKEKKLEGYGHAAALKWIKDNNIDPDTHAVTMTSIPKVGINPGSEYNTPIGIYFYPMDYYINTINRKSKLPFAHDQKYINILKFKSNKILDLSKYDSVFDINQIESLANNEKVKEQTKDFIDLSYTGSRTRTDGGRLWYVLMALSKYLSNSKSKIFKKSYKAPIIWNWLIRQMGYDIVIDPDNEGIIHENEPTQGFATSLKSIQWVKTFDNVDDYSLSQRKGILILNDPDAPESEKVDILKDQPELITGINNPSDAMKWAAIKSRSYVIQFIKNPTEEMQEFVVERDYNNIRWILEPTQKVRRLVIDETLGAIFNKVATSIFTEDDMIYAVEKYPESIRYMYEPSEKVQLLAFSKVAPENLEWVAGIIFDELSDKVKALIADRLKQKN